MNNETATVMMAQNEINNRQKSVGIAYALWLLLGMFGAHRFYSGQIGYAVAMMFLGWFTLGLWNLIDAFFLAAAIQRHNEQLANEVYRKYNVTHR